MPINTTRLKNLTYAITLAFFAFILVEMVFGFTALSTITIVLALVVNASIVAFAYFLPSKAAEAIEEELFSINK